MKADAAGLKPLSADSSVLVGESFWPYSHVVYVVHMLIPFGWTVSVGLFRTFDHRQSISDVLAGVALGLIVALAVYRMHLIQIAGSYRRFEEEAAERGAAISAAAPLPQRQTAAPSVLLEGSNKQHAESDSGAEDQLPAKRNSQKNKNTARGVMQQQQTSTAPHQQPLPDFPSARSLVLHLASPTLSSPARSVSPQLMPHAFVQPIHSRC